MSIGVSFINMKGGVGKTTLAMQTALASQGAGLKVLAVDLDPQSNLTQALVARLDTESPGKARLIRELAGLYEQGRFLPNLRMAEDFVARRTGQRPKLKSRRAALPSLLRVLAAIPAEELPRVRDEWTFNRASGDYELLARAIMGAK